MNPNDYDDDGNNIVPCPICLSQYCPSKDGGKCPDEEDFIKSITNMNNKQWEEELMDEFAVMFERAYRGGDESYWVIKLENFIRQREAEIRKEYEFDTNKSLEDKIDNIINNPPTWTDGNPKSQLERIMGVFNAELSKIRKETIKAVMPEREIYRFIRDRERPEEIEYKNQVHQQIIESDKSKFNITL